jgi:HPt (histidine-containing phosphotransfer) domain-containing protein
LNDEKKLNTNESISLAAKSAATECHADDRNYELARRLANILFPIRGRTDITDEPNSHLKQYRLLTSKLRKHIRVVESQMAHNQWSEINYETVPAKSHRLHKSAFKKHDPERYQKYIEDVLANKKQIKSTGVQAS